jgi:hypothetical protein
VTPRILPCKGVKCGPGRYCDLQTQKCESICKVGHVYNPYVKRCVEMPTSSSTSMVSSPCPLCKPGRVCNPRTKRCEPRQTTFLSSGLPISIPHHNIRAKYNRVGRVRSPGAHGPCRANQVAHPNTGVCLSKNSFIGRLMSRSNKTKKQCGRCDPDRICNPATGNCVLRAHHLGKKIINGHDTTAPKQCRMPCASTQICNPASGYCVNIYGATGKKILRERRGVRFENGTKTTNGVLHRGRWYPSPSA